MSTTKTQRDYQKKYEQAHERVTCMFPKGTRERIAAAGLPCSPTKFVQFSAEFMLNFIESSKKKEV